MKLDVLAGVVDFDLESLDAEDGGDDGSRDGDADGEAPDHDEDRDGATDSIEVRVVL